MLSYKFLFQLSYFFNLGLDYTQNESGCRTQALKNKTLI